MVISLVAMACIGFIFSLPYEIIAFVFRKQRTYIWEHGHPVPATITKRQVGEFLGRSWPGQVPFRLRACYEVNGQTYDLWGHVSPKQYTTCPVGSKVQIKLHPTKPGLWVLDCGQADVAQ